MACLLMSGTMICCTGIVLNYFIVPAFHCYLGVLLCSIRSYCNPPICDICEHVDYKVLCPQFGHSLDNTMCLVLHV